MSRSRGERDRDRGNLFDFYDPEVSARYLKPKKEKKVKKTEEELKWEQLSKNIEKGHTIAAKREHGLLTVDSTHLLNNFDKEFDKAWFCRSRKHALNLYPNRSKRIILFNEDQPAAAVAVASNTASRLDIQNSLLEEDENSEGRSESDDDERDLLKPELAVTHNHNPLITEASMQRSRHSIMQTAKIRNSAYTTGTRALMALRNASYADTAADTVGAISVEADKSVDNIKTRRYFGKSIHHKATSPDIILFVESMNKRIVPCIVRDLRVEKDSSGNYSSGSDIESIDVPPRQPRQGARSSKNTKAAATTTTTTNVDALLVAVNVLENKIVSIDMNQRGIGNEKGMCLSSALQYCPQLTLLNIAGNRLNGNGSLSVLRALFHHTKCKELTFKDNALQDESMQLLAANLESGDCRLTYLDLSNCGIDDDDCSTLLKAMADNSTVETLVLSQNPFVPLKDQVPQLSAYSKNISEALSKVFEVNSSLITLDLSSCGITGDWAQSMARSLALNKSLQYVTLAHNQLNDSTAILIAHSLSVNTALKTLDLSFNNLSSRGAFVLSHAAAYNENSAMVSLNLKGNPIGSRGIVACIEAMRRVSCDKTASNYGQSTTTSTSTSTSTSTTTITTAKNNNNNNSHDRPRRKFVVEYDDLHAPLKELVECFYKPTANGKYRLKLDNYYDRAVAVELIDLVAKNPAAKIPSCKYFPASKSQSSSEHVILLRKQAAAPSLQADRKDVTGLKLKMEQWIKAIGLLNEAIDQLRSENMTKIEIKSNKRQPSAEVSSLIIRARDCLVRVGKLLGMHRSEIIGDLVQTVLQTLMREDTQEKSGDFILKTIYGCTYDIITQRSQSLTITPTTAAAAISPSTLKHYLAAIGLDPERHLIPQHDTLMVANRFISESAIQDHATIARVQFVQTMLYRFYDQFGALQEPSPLVESFSASSSQYIVPSSGELHIEVVIPPMCMLPHRHAPNSRVTSFIECISTTGEAYPIVSSAAEETGTAIGKKNTGGNIANDKVASATIGHSAVCSGGGNSSSNCGDKSNSNKSDAAAAAATVSATEPKLSPSKKYYSDMHIPPPKTGKSRSHLMSKQILLGTANILYLSCEQAEFLLERLKADSNEYSHVQLVEMIMYQLVSTNECCRFLTRNLYFEEIALLRKKMRYVFKILTGNVSGHYLLDLTNSMDRVAATRLHELNNFYKMVLQQQTGSKLAALDTSQEGNGECYRNGSFNGKYVLLDDTWFSSMPIAGKVRFDFCATIRPPHGMPSSINNDATISTAAGHQAGANATTDRAGAAAEVRASVDIGAKSLSATSSANANAAAAAVAAAAFTAYEEGSSSYSTSTAITQAALDKSKAKLECIKHDHYMNSLLKRMFYPINYSEKRIAPKNCKVADSKLHIPTIIEEAPHAGGSANLYSSERNLMLPTSPSGKRSQLIDSDNKAAPELLLLNSNAAFVDKIKKLGIHSNVMGSSKKPQHASFPKGRSRTTSSASSAACTEDVDDGTEDDETVEESSNDGSRSSSRGWGGSGDAANTSVGVGGAGGFNDISRNLNVRTSAGMVVGVLPKKLKSSKKKTETGASDASATTYKMGNPKGRLKEMLQSENYGDANYVSLCTATWRDTLLTSWSRYQQCYMEEMKRLSAVNYGSKAASMTGPSTFASTLPRGVEGGSSSSSSSSSLADGPNDDVSIGMHSIQTKDTLDTQHYNDDASQLASVRSRPSSPLLSIHTNAQQQQQEEEEQQQLQGQPRGNSSNNKNNGKNSSSNNKQVVAAAVLNKAVSAADVAEQQAALERKAIHQSITFLGVGSSRSINNYNSNNNNNKNSGFGSTDINTTSNNGSKARPYTAAAATGRKNNNMPVPVPVRKNSFNTTGTGTGLSRGGGSEYAAAVSSLAALDDGGGDGTNFTPIMLEADCLLYEEKLVSLEVTLLYNIWLTCDESLLIVHEFLKMGAPQAVLVRCLCTLFKCIVDIENFSSIILVPCGDEVRLEIFHRLGILNVWCPLPCNLAGRYELDLAAKDHWKAAALLVRTSVLCDASTSGPKGLLSMTMFSKSFADVIGTCARPALPPAGWSVPKSWKSVSKSKSSQQRKGGIANPAKTGHLHTYVINSPVDTDVLNALTELTEQATLALVHPSMMWS